MAWLRACCAATVRSASAARCWAPAPHSSAAMSSTAISPAAAQPANGLSACHQGRPGAAAARASGSGLGAGTGAGGVVTGSADAFNLLRKRSRWPAGSSGTSRLKARAGTTDSNWASSARHAAQVGRWASSSAASSGSSAPRAYAASCSRKRSSPPFVLGFIENPCPFPIRGFPALRAT